MKNFEDNVNPKCIAFLYNPRCGHFRSSGETSGKSKPFGFKAVDCLGLMVGHQKWKKVRHRTRLFPLILFKLETYLGNYVCTQEQA